MDRRQHGHSTVRTNNHMRYAVDSNIRSFFSEAKERLSKPDFQALTKPLIAHLEIDKEIHPFFYDISWTRLFIELPDYGQYNLNVPEGRYGMLDADDEHNSYYFTVKVPADKVPEAITKYYERKKEMEAACEALCEGAREAMKERTTEKALIRMPELKRFLP